jgi:hypothetical protein
MGVQTSGLASRILDSNPRWLSLTLIESAAATATTGALLLFGFVTPDITPVTMILHLVWAIAVSSWVLSLRIRMPPEKRAVLGLGVALAFGSAWGLVQQWLGYVSTGLLNDPLMVVAAMVMDGLGGGITYVLYQFNILERK